jgi:hypothetical protein
MQVGMQRAQMSVGTTRSVAQQAQAHTVAMHWPVTAIGTFSSLEQVQRLRASGASQRNIAVYSAVQAVPMSRIVPAGTPRQAVAQVAVSAAAQGSPVCVLQVAAQS